MRRGSRNTGCLRLAPLAWAATVDVIVQLTDLVLVAGGTEKLPLSVPVHPGLRSFITAGGAKTSVAFARSDLIDGSGDQLELGAAADDAGEVGVAPSPDLEDRRRLRRLGCWHGSVFK